MGSGTLSKKTALVLEDALPVGALPDTLSVHGAAGPLATAKLLSELRPELIVASATVAWQRALLATLPARRPAVLLVGEPDGLEPWLDEWVPPGVTPGELAARLKVALARAAEKRRSARRLFVDPLTGLPNRRAVVRALVREAGRARRCGTEVCLVILDLNDFKRVNETRGHPEGDRLLRRVGAALRRTVRSHELCGRIGGDEFAFVVNGREEDADALIDRVAEALLGCGVTACAAACELRPHERLRALYRRADERLTRQKEVSRARRAMALTPLPPSGVPEEEEAESPSQPPGDSDALTQ